ncbi:dTDP-4-dehydrorhamnose 3,5-epimerase family protein [Dactylosporangium sp. AC04546]|uniref:dTDP-4-dehydrorhamnose 3,5-epimerase family protein n=1 Tax=Dactylosporangium sp. AC04546 TaxID=2862460 RepID=UPI001EDC9F4F|nr:dTDP-4-dehydrorhamnose 3,5-epimerase family protein [Dactylosporangium sp. AC04546]WVK79057.1 dTDP-4-dehydrorhamnose 3,5-epimerase family protein [Dactylosporangium sp. AC04546]
MTAFEPLPVPGALLVRPKPLADSRGVFFESVRFADLEAATGQRFRPEQVNYSVSRRNTLRGLHGVAVPPGQAKFVTCVRGAVRDIVVDLRLGSPCFGAHAVNVLTAAAGDAVYVPEGVVHGFLALTDDACVAYVLSTAHQPGTQVDVNPLDPALALPWDFAAPPLLSAKDAQAPTVAEAHDRGLLATWTG